MTERSEVSRIESEESFIERASEIMKEMTSVAPKDVQCLMTCIVSEDGSLKVGILGSDMDIAKMLMTLTTVARNGVVTAQDPPNPNNEAIH